MLLLADCPSGASPIDLEEAEKDKPFLVCERSSRRFSLSDHVHGFGTFPSD